MNRTFQKTYLILSLAPLLFSSCVSFKAVSDFSSASSASIKKFEDIGYSFKQHCYERQQFEAIRNFDIKKDVETNCGNFIKADSVTFILYKAINGYFTSLTNLANNKLTNYKVDALKKSITEGDFGNIKIDKQQVDSYSKISNILLNAATADYRKNKLIQYIDSGNAPIQVLLEKFRFIIQENLRDLLEFKKERLFMYTMDMKMGETLSEYEKGKAVIEYYAQLSDINARQKQINSYARGLKSIAKGHQDIYDNRKKMSAKEMKELLSSFISDVEDIISEFNKLKK